MLELSRLRSHRFHIHQVGVVLSVLFLLSQVAGLIHFIVVPHSTCSEHGDLVHVTKAPPAHGHVEHLPARFAKETPPRAEEHEHDHCVLSVHGRERWTLSSRQLVPEAPHPSVATVVAGTDRVVFRSFPVYLLAPKASPPIC